jgi:hypothetical protein
MHPALWSENLKTKRSLARSRRLREIGFEKVDRDELVKIRLKGKLL